MTYTSNERSPLLRGSDELEGGSANPNGNVRYHSNTGSDWASRTRIDQAEGAITKTITRRKSRIGPLEISRSERYAILAGVWTATFLSVRVPNYFASLHVNDVDDSTLCGLTFSCRDPLFVVSE